MVGGIANAAAVTAIVVVVGMMIVMIVVVDIHPSIHPSPGGKIVFVGLLRLLVGLFCCVCSFVCHRVCFMPTTAAVGAINRFTDKMDWVNERMKE